MSMEQTACSRCGAPAEGAAYCSNCGARLTTETVRGTDTDDESGPAAATLVGIGVLGILVAAAIVALVLRAETPTDRDQVLVPVGSPAEDPGIASGGAGVPPPMPPRLPLCERSDGGKWLRQPGCVAWRHTLPTERVISSSPVTRVGDGSVIVPGGRGGLARIATGSGEQLWASVIPAGRPTVVDATEEQIVVATGSRLIVLDTSDGRRHWARSLPHGISEVVLSADRSNLAVAGDGRVSILGLSDGATIASHAAGEVQDLIVSPGARPILFVIGRNTVSAIDLVQGEPAWRAPVRQGVAAWAILADDLLVVDLAGHVSRHRRADGVALWTTEAPPERPVPVGDRIPIPAVPFDTLLPTTDALLVLGHGGLVRLQARDGAVDWSEPAVRPAARADRASRGGLLVVSGAARPGQLVAVDATDGSRRWTSTLEGLVLSVTATDQIFAVTAGQAIAVDPASGAPLWRLRTDDDILTEAIDLGDLVLVVGERAVYAVRYVR